jgi:anti-sigma B factor antagonist
VKKTSTIFVGQNERTVWVRVQGRGTFENAPCLKDFVRRMISKGHSDFIVDLEPCESMDSTFMGILASIAFRLRELGDGTLHVVRANQRNFDLLEGLGLDHLFPVEPDPGIPAPTSLHATGDSRDEQETPKTTILQAHQALVEADPRNAIRFQDVIEYLRLEVGGGNCGA